MARIPTASQLGAPSFGGGRAVRQIPNVEIPTMDIPVPNLPSGVNVPTVNIQAPNVPSSVPIANDYNIGNVQVPDTLYTSGQIDALGAPGRAWSNLGRTISSESDRWLTQLNALELERANIAKTQGFAQIAKELDEDKDYKSWLPRYQAAAEKVRKDALSNITMPNHAERWARQFDERVANDLEGLRKKAYRAEAEDGRKELDKIIETRQGQIRDKWVSDTDKRQARKDVDEAISKMESLGYITKEDADVKRVKFKTDEALTSSSEKIAEGKGEEVLQELAGGKGLYNLERTSPEVQQAAVKAAEDTGLPIQYIAEMAHARGGFDAEKPGVGLFKMSDDEWVASFEEWANRAPREMGVEGTTRAEQYGLDQLKQDSPVAWRAAVLNMRNDPVLEMTVGAEQMMGVRDKLMSQIETYPDLPGDFKITPKDIFLTQTLGEEQAVELMRFAIAAPRTKVGDVWDQETISALGLDRTDTMKQAYDWLTKDVSDGELPSAYTDLDEATKLSLKNKAESHLYKTNTESNRQLRVNKANVESAMKGSIEEMANEGKVRPGMEPDPQEIAKLLGPEKALEYARDMDASQAIYDLTDDIPNLPSETLKSVYENLTPDDFPGMDYSRFTRVKSAFEKKMKAAEKLRKSDPALAVSDHTRVLAVVDTFNDLEAAQSPEGVTSGENDIAITKERKLAEARIAAQRELGLEEAPITKDQAKVLMRRVAASGVPTKDSLIETVNEVETIYGEEMGRKVMATAIAQHIKNKKNAELATKVVDRAFSSKDFTFEDLQADLRSWTESMPDDYSARFLAEPALPRSMSPNVQSIPQSFPKPPPAAVERLRAEPHLAESFAQKYGVDALLKIFKTMPRLMTPVPPVN